MKKRILKVMAVVTAVVLCVLCTTVIADPGTNADPLISKSYIDNILLPQIQQMIDSKVAGAGGSGGNAASFAVVEARAGQEIICSAGAELILRMGSATVIATSKGGLADTTAGCDLGSGANMPANHLLVVPVSDGRGIRANANVIVLIKGGYTVR